MVVKSLYQEIINVFTVVVSITSQSPLKLNTHGSETQEFCPHKGQSAVGLHQHDVFLRRQLLRNTNKVLYDTYLGEK